MPFNSLKQLLVSVSMFVCSPVFATPLTFDVTGIQSDGALGTAQNVVFQLNIGANATITSVAYDVSLTAFTPSWLSELKLAFTDSAFSTGVLLTPGVGQTQPGSASYAGAVDLVAQGLSFSVGADGILRLEFYEGYDDFLGADGVWNAGTVTFNVEGGTGTGVPEPSTGPLFAAGLALAAACRARRRTADACAVEKYYSSQWPPVPNRQLLTMNQ